MARNCSVCSEKMAAPGQKSFFVLEYHTSKSVVTVQRAFRAKYAKEPPTDKNMYIYMYILHVHIHLHVICTVEFT